MVIRDFIYVDGDRLYSLYSQAFEGVAEQIVQSYINELGSADHQKGPLLSGGAIATQVAEISRRTENKLLYDHMYSQLEEKLAAAILEPSGLTSENYIDTLSDTYLVKVAGATEIEDHERLQMFLAKFNELGEAIAYSSLASSGIAEEMTSAASAVAKIKDPNKRVRAKGKTKGLDIKSIAREAGLIQDERTLQNLRLFGDMFSSDGFEVTITPDGDEIAFRAVLDKRWLRVQRELLRALYGVRPGSKWTLVGQVTHIPGTGRAAASQVTEMLESESDSDDPSMRDPFRNMFRASSVFEKMFLESQQRHEIIVAPLAIYREYTL